MSRDGVDIALLIALPGFGEMMVGGPQRLLRLSRWWAWRCASSVGEEGLEAGGFAPPDTSLDSQPVQTHSRLGVTSIHGCCKDLKGARCFV